MCFLFEKQIILGKRWISFVNEINKIHMLFHNSGLLTHKWIISTQVEQYWKALGFGCRNISVHLRNNEEEQHLAEDLLSGHDHPTQYILPGKHNIKYWTG